MLNVRFRPATAADVPAIAALHARSWQETYTAAMSALYLVQEAPAERLAEWTRRFATALTPDPMRVLLAEVDGELVGFCCLYLDHDPVDGTLLDNLHVRADQQGSGLGRNLIDWARRAAVEETVSGRLYLWVLDSNVRARKVYEHLGGRPGRSARKPLPGGGPEGIAATSIHW